MTKEDFHAIIALVGAMGTIILFMFYAPVNGAFLGIGMLIGMFIHHLIKKSDDSRKSPIRGAAKK